MAGYIDENGNPQGYTWEEMAEGKMTRDLENFRNSSSSAAVQLIGAYNTNPLGQYGISYDPNTAQNLSQVGAMTGQNIGSIGQTSKQYQDLIQKRLAGQDEGSRYTQQQANRNLANVSRAYSGKGVGGGATLASQNEASMAGGNAASKQMQDAEASNMALLKTERDRNQQATASAIASGQQMFQATNTPTFSGGSGGGTVICTELYRQGLISNEDYAQDQRFGIELEKKNPFMIHGYRILATPIAEKMKSSKALTFAVSLFAIPWAKGMNKKSNIFYKSVVKIYMITAFVPLTVTGIIFKEKFQEA